MTSNSNVKTLIKILIGTAWIDGKIHPEERRYLHRIAQEKGLANDLEIQPILHELRAVKSEECYQWVKEYLGDRPTSDDCQTLIESISALIYSDGTVATEEAQLLARLQLVDAASETTESLFDKVLAVIRKIYQRGISEL
ncbi:MAG: TerB family tellurite resistance protein [Leptolyngbyaceae cyanobacterium SU_3_3]|nr:TerB family tellurite resistance protein [Leptolyngbyaceae cyanobacterium SU_3_3]NJR50021.1 TerB family tellurite resistance protein [Leptolyngbyaceae cyanobacterium CSU_1_3]